MHYYNGVPLHVSPFAVATGFEVQRMPIKKKRKNYRVVRYSRPGAYQLADGTLVMHPEVYAKLRVHVEQHQLELNQ